MEKTQTFRSIISLNAQEAKDDIADLEKRLEALKKKKTDALRNPETLVKDINKFDKQIKAAEASIKAYGSNVSKTIDVINNLGTSSPDFVIVSPKILHQRVWRFSDALPSTWFGCKPPCSEVA